jgi:hypothetical protein
MVLFGFRMEPGSSRKRSYVSRSERDKIFSQQPLTGVEGRHFLNKICSVFMEGNIIKISMLHIFDNT